jgi:hypothetical protein
MSIHFDRDPAVLGLSLAAETVYQRALRWSKETRTGGVVPKDCLVMLSRRVPNIKAVATELVAAGLWGDEAKFHTIRSFHKWNMDEGDFEEYTTEKSRAGALGSHKRWHAGRDKSLPDSCGYCAADRLGLDVGDDFDPAAALNAWADKADR